MKQIILLLGLIAFSLNLNGQSNYWSEAEFQIQESDILLTKAPKTLKLNYNSLVADLLEAPMEFTQAARKKSVLIDLPLPSGTIVTFEVVESPNFKPSMASRYPGIKAFSASATDGSGAYARLDISLNGLHAIIRSQEGWSFVRPYDASNGIYQAFAKKDLDVIGIMEGAPATGCGYDAEDMIIDDMHDHDEMHEHNEELAQSRSTNAELVVLDVYDMALACTGEFAQAHGGTVESVNAAFNTCLNFVNAILQSQPSVRFQLIENNDDLVFLNPGTDPYPVANVGTELLGLNEAALNSIIGLPNFDIGHVFTQACTDVGGVVSGVTCSAGKGRGVTCHYSNSLEFISTNVMAHEIAHQFSAAHTWSNCPGILGQLASGSAYEPGSGSTIMSYQGSCGNQNIGGFGEPYYHVRSIDQINLFTETGTGATCGDHITTDNHYPDIVLPYEDGFFIPIETPFELEASATDVDGDNLTYCWEQYNLGPLSDLGEPTGNSPIFRSYQPTTDNFRVFPRMQAIVNNNFNNEEVLPTYSRDLNFRFTVRDNVGEHGGVSTEEVAFFASASAGPFVVTSYNGTGLTWTQGEQVTLTWDVANTNNTIVDCQAVDILLSTDGGFTYDITLVEGVPNSGSYELFVPNLLGNSCRFKVKASENVFFDINNKNFSIVENTDPYYTFNFNSDPYNFICVPETNLSVEFAYNGFNGYDSTLNLSVLTEMPEGISYTLSADQLNPGDTGNIEFSFDNSTNNNF